VNQAELRKMAVERLKDAKALLGRKRWEFAYYTAGYSVECALKACILARMIHTAWVFEDKWKAQECLTHDPKELVRLAGLNGELATRLAASAAAAATGGGPPGGAFTANWETVTQWKVESRYLPRTEDEARKLYAAIADKPDGVLAWIKKYW
jgi:hypothetical protein